MLMAGEAAARFALDRHIPAPFATQESISAREQPQTLSEMIALRRDLQRSQYKNTPAPHGGVGLATYCQATSPLRRYLDLVVHQQLRAYLRGDPILDSQAILERIGAAESVLGGVRQVEWLSARHWTLVYLLRRPDWRGEGIVVEKRGAPGQQHTVSGKVLIPELGMEIQTRLPAGLPLDSSVTLFVRGVNLAYLDAHFGVEL
jgi:exoribonuclease-2